MFLLQVTNITFASQFFKECYKLLPTKERNFIFLFSLDNLLLFLREGKESNTSAFFFFSCCLCEGDMGGPWTLQHRKKKLMNTASPNHTRNHSTANNFVSPNTAAWNTQTSHTIRFEITATPQIEILVTASPHQKNINTANPYVPLLCHCIWKTSDFQVLLYSS